MQEQQQGRRLPVGIVAGVSALVLAAGGGSAWWAWNSGQSTPTTQAPTTTQPSSPKPLQASAEKTVQVYWLKSTGNRIEVVPSAINLEDANQPNTVLEKAFDRLLAGPTDPKLASTIPTDTKLRSVAIREDGVHVDLSQEFTSGGGSTSMSGRLAQVIYTASSLDPNAKVWIMVEGKKLEVLGGEGLEIEQPATRKSFEENFDL